MHDYEVAGAHAAHSPWRSRGLLVFSAVLFGTMFVPTQRAVDDLTPIGAVAVRFAIGAVVLAPFMWRHRADVAARRREYATGTVLAGAVNVTGFVLQALALQRTTASSVAFLSSLFIVLVPLIVALMSGRLPSSWVASGVAIAIVGSYFLAGASFRLGAGDALALAAAVASSFHIIVMARFAPRLAAPVLAGGQMTVMAVIATVGTLLTSFGDATAAAIACLAYCAVAMAMALGVQSIAQRAIDATSGAVILILVPVIGAITGVALVDDPVTGSLVVGVALIVLAVFVAEVIPLRRAERQRARRAGDVVETAAVS